MSDYAFLYDSSLSQYELSDSHPFKPIRLELTRSLLHMLGILDSKHEVEPEPISEAELLKVHDKSYVDMVKAVSRGEKLNEAYGFGLGTGDNPIFSHMHTAIMGVCSATTTAVELVASGQKQRAINLSGGLHHAHKKQASGFCVYNDLAVGIERAVEKYGMRVAYLDIDAHHGDGVQWLFYDCAEVMTISLHESGRYLFPGTGHTYETGKEAGRGMSVNLPLEPFTEGESYLEGFEAIVPEVLRFFKPDLIVLQAGADMHRFDPLADLALDISAMHKSYQRVSELADELCEGRLVATGGGGYDPYRTVPRAWAGLWAALSRQDLAADIPQGWLESWQEQSPVELPLTIPDNLKTWKPIPRRAEIESHNRSVAKRLMNTLTPIWKEL
ncbi:MAG: acetoin utilization protein AcuC [Trueperaceae bacterium]|nr:acetoin utilization protein AcuC [Trueperaceae bacterium]